MLVSGTLMVVALSDLKSVPLQTWKPQPWHHPCSTLVWNIGETLGAKSCCDPSAWACMWQGPFPCLTLANALALSLAHPLAFPFSKDFALPLPSTLMVVAFDLAYAFAFAFAFRFLGPITNLFRTPTPLILILIMFIFSLLLLCILIFVISACAIFFIIVRTMLTARLCIIRHIGPPSNVVEDVLADAIVVIVQAGM